MNNLFETASSKLAYLKRLWKNGEEIGMEDLVPKRIRGERKHSVMAPDGSPLGWIEGFGRGWSWVRPPDIHTIVVDEKGKAVSAEVR